MTRIVFAVLAASALLVAGNSTASAAWWPFGKSDKKNDAKVSARTPIKPTPTTKTPSKSSWSLFSSDKSSGDYPPPYAGVGTTYGARREPEKKSWFSSWFKKEEPQRIQSIDDFMSLERPSP